MNDLLECEPRCTECGNALRAHARYCDRCGAAVGDTRRAAERKLITVLFADVVQSMQLAAKLGPERLQEVMFDLFNGSAAAVQRYQGTVDKFTGDGLMAVFGAPVALEHHALRACLAALDVQASTRTLAADVHQRDGADLRLRVGLNSGEVVAAEMGSGPHSYTVVGHPVGLAQRIESLAEPGAVLCSEWTSRLAGPAAVFGPPRTATVRGSSEPITVRQLTGIEADTTFLPRDDGPLVGRGDELAWFVQLLQTGSTGVAHVVGDAGVGKSRLVREFSAESRARGGRTVTARCEAHTSQVPLSVASSLLRALFDIRGVDENTIRARVSEQLSQDVDVDVVLDFLALSDAVSMTVPQLKADVRRSRLVDVLVRRARVEHPQTIYVVEDLHWIDIASEGLLRDFATALDGDTPLIVTTARPQYDGAIRTLAAHTIAISPLQESEASALLAALMGPDPGTRAVMHRIVHSSGGNPFFLEELVRDLVDQGILEGHRGAHRLVRDATSMPVPRTVQAVISARIDRLPAREKSILNAAAVIGAAFDHESLNALAPCDDRCIGTLLAAELIDQTELLPVSRYQFRHPLVRAVCYEAQLQTVRAASHRRLAEYLQSRVSESECRDAGLIAHHLEAAGELAKSYAEYMRSAEWLFHRDMGAARDSWKRAAAVADRMPDGDGVVAMRIAPRAQLCFTAWLVGGQMDEDQRMADLRRLTAETNDKLPLALGLAGRVNSIMINDGRPRDAISLVAELDELYADVDGSDGERAEILTTIALAHYSLGAFDAALTVIDKLRTSGLKLTPYFLTPATAMSGVIKVLGGRRVEGQRDLRDARDMSLAHDPVNFAGAVAYSVDCVILGFELVDDTLLQQTATALQLAENHGNASGHPSYGVSLARWAHGTALLNGAPSGRAEGLKLLELSRSAEAEMAVGPVAAQLAAEYARRGTIDDSAIDALKEQVLRCIDSGNVCFLGYRAAQLVRLLAARNRLGDLNEAESLVAALETEFAPLRRPSMDLWSLHCRMLVARARADTVELSKVRACYRALADRLGAAGHLAMIDEVSV